MAFGEDRENVKFETIKAEEMKFGNKNFVEVARKKAVSDTGENEFISISRGFFTQDGSKRFTKSIAVPEEVADFIADKLKEMKK